MQNTKQVNKVIDASNRVLIIFNNTFIRENLCAALGLYAFLTKAGKKVDIISTYKVEQEGSSLAFLPNFSLINKRAGNDDFVIKVKIRKEKLNKIRYKLEDDFLKFTVSNSDKSLAKDAVFTYREIQYDTFICIGLSSLEEIGELYTSNKEQFLNGTVVNINSDSASSDFGDINYARNDDIAMSQLILSLIGYSEVTKDIATCLFCSLIHKTNYFKNRYVNANVLEISSKLMELGADKDGILRKMFNSRGVSDMKSWGETLMNVNSELDEKLVWFNYRYTNASISVENIEGGIIDLVNELVLTIKKIYVVVIFYEFRTKNGVGLNALVISESGINISDARKKYNCLGTKRIMRINGSGEIGKFREDVLGIARRGTMM